MPTKIHGAEYPIQKIFCDDFVFSIPLYQRPYSWEPEQAEALLDDLLDFLGDSDDPIDAINPYFLGSIVLIKPEGAPDAEVVDGQQRLTTLAILISVLREVLPPERNPDKLTKFLYEEGDDFTGTKNRYRLTLRDRDATFFQKYIQDKGGLRKLADLKEAVLTDSQSNIRDNALLYLERLDQMPVIQRFRLAQFLITGCLLVVVSTPDLDSAYRIFSVLNDRGMDLSHTDILKSEIIGRIPETQQSAYNKQWEDAEEMLGRASFQDLFSHIRMIYRRAKSKDSVLKEFRQYVQPAAEDPTRFMDKVLCPLAEAYAVISDAAYQSTQDAEEINTLFHHLNRIDNADWIPPAILYLSKYLHQPTLLLRFFRDLDRLASGLMIRRANINDRIKRYSQLLNAIEADADLYSPDSPLQLKSKECDRIIEKLNGDLYRELKIRQYVLLRLDTALSGGDATYAFRKITVEHVLPQNPAPNSQWLKWFPSEDLHEQHVHRLSNLVLLSRAKNSKAQNYEFDVKKQKYFTGSDGVSPFALTTQVLHTEEWTPQILERRQTELLEKLKCLWRLDPKYSIP
ncbi:MAG: DUF262 domain-containing HNH endonuclease family protein [Cyanobacteria bacterium P01_A01_bin.17]